VGALVVEVVADAGEDAQGLGGQLVVEDVAGREGDGLADGLVVDAELEAVGQAEGEVAEDLEGGLGLGLGARVAEDLVGGTTLA
jgi:hypothetical protein